MPAGEKTRLLAAWGDSYREFTVMVKKLERAELLRKLSGPLSERQVQNWVNWPELQNHIVPLVQEARTVLGGPAVPAGRSALKVSVAGTEASVLKNTESRGDTCPQGYV